MASNNSISIKLDLLRIPGATKHENNGVQWVSIPIEYANLYNGEKGVYLDATAWPLDKPRDGSKDTHMIKQSFSKEKFAAMTQDEKNATPILGNAIQWDKPASSNSSSPSETKGSASKPPSFM